MKTTALLVLLALCLSCQKEKIGVIEGPPLTIARPSSSVPAPAPAPAPARTFSSNPVTASFLDLAPAGKNFKFTACEQIILAIVKGTAHVAEQPLHAGDVFVAQGSGSFTAKGTGLAVVALVQPPHCEPNQATKITKTVIRASAAPELTWASGEMHAHLDVGPEVSPNAYLGRLEGSALVVEHSHPDSWEILCAVEAAGTFMLEGKASRLGPREIVAVPPGAKHSWNPDGGSKLVAIQLYSPPGPEQRFKTLAFHTAVLADAGVSDPPPGWMGLR